MAKLSSHLSSDIYFVHGTSISSRIWKSSVVQAIAQLFGETRHINLFDWCGSNNTQARKDASEALLKKISHRSPSSRIILVGHSHGGSVILHASQQFREAIEPGTKISILTLNTPNVVGGADLQDPRSKHYHIYCTTDEVAPRGGYNKTGMLTQGGERTNWLGKPIGGEYSYKKDLGSGKEGSIHWEFDSALLNIDYRDQYRFKGISPRTHWVSHRGWLEKNVEEWLPKLAAQMGGLIHEFPSKKA